MLNIGIKMFLFLKIKKAMNNHAFKFTQPSRFIIISVFLLSLFMKPGQERYSFDTLQSQIPSIIGGWNGQYMFALETRAISVDILI